MSVCSHQLNDCHRGVVIDGLDSLFSPAHGVAALALLRAFNNRKYIFFMSLKLDYASMKESQRLVEQEKGAFPLRTVNSQQLTAAVSHQTFVN